jgi:hypothetical protein
MASHASSSLAGGPCAARWTGCQQTAGITVQEGQGASGPMGGAVVAKALEAAPSDALTVQVKLGGGYRTF